MRILLVGANGQLGYELRRSLSQQGVLTATTRNGILADGTSCETLDVEDAPAFASLLDRIEPDVVVNATAYTAVDRAEDHPAEAYRINEEAPAALAALCARRDAALVHYSTDYVFDGTSTRPWREDDPTAPLNVYGASKRAGEEAILASGARHLILRTAWLYGLRGSNFLRTMLRLAEERDVLRVVSDQHGCPTPAWLVADITAKILGQGIRASGIRHLVAGGETTWYGFAEAIFEEAFARGLLGRRPRVEAIASRDYPTRAVRPAYSVLDTERLAGEYGLALPDWRDALCMTFDRPAA